MEKWTQSQRQRPVWMRVGERKEDVLRDIVLRIQGLGWKTRRERTTCILLK
jgi:hypothetical protein